MVGPNVCGLPRLLLPISHQAGGTMVAIPPSALDSNLNRGIRFTLNRGIRFTLCSNSDVQFAN